MDVAQLYAHNIAQPVDKEGAVNKDVVDVESTDDFVPQPPPRFYVPRRYILMFMCFLAAVISYADRTNISVAIIPMAEKFNWNKVYEGWILTSFWIGYGTTQLIGGWAGDRWGGKIVLSIGIITWSLFTVITPPAVYGGTVLLVLCRVLMGIGEGVGFPAVQTMISKWIPPRERTRAAALMATGCYIGTILPLSSSPGIIAALGWPSVFYIFGSFGFVWVIFWFFIASSTPQQHPSIHPSELDYITTSQLDYGREHGASGADRNEPILPDESNIEDQAESGLLPQSTNTSRRHKPRVPWGVIFSSPAVWAIIINQFCSGYAFFVLLSWMPTYFHDVYKIDLEKLGTYVVCPYIVQGCCGLSVGYLADYIVGKKWMSMRGVRLTAQSIGLLVPSIFLSVLCFGKFSSVWTVVIIISLASGFGTFTVAGVSVSHLDIAPDFSGVVYGVGNTAGVLSAIIGTPLTGWILHMTENSWTAVFLTTMGTSLLGTVVWVLFSEAHVVIKAEDHSQKDNHQ